MSPTDSFGYGHEAPPALVVGSTPTGQPVFAPEGVHLAEVLSVRPRACRPYQAKTKGKVERVIRELR